MNCGQVADSDGVIHRGPDIARLEARRRRYRRRMARQRKNSNRRAVTRMRLRKTQRKLRQARHNWRHHVSRTLANTAHTVVVEDLRTRSMTRSAKGTVDSPGSNVRAKAGLNRSILATGWNQLRAMLEYKAGEVIAVPACETSIETRLGRSGIAVGVRYISHIVFVFSVTLPSRTGRRGAVFAVNDRRWARPRVNAPSNSAR